MAAPKEGASHISSTYIEICCQLAMRCSQCDSMSNVDRFYFLDKLKSQRHRQNLLARCLCEYHCSSKWSFYLWDKISESEMPEKDELMKMMFALGNASVDLSAFNLYVGCMTQWDFFKNCRVPKVIPEFAAQSMLSRSCNVPVSWEKAMLKLDEAFQVESLTDEVLLRAMLACRILIFIEATEKTPVLRMNDKGRELLQNVLPCKVSTSCKVWPASSLCFYSIFSWMERVGLIEQAIEEFITSYSEVLEESGHRFLSVTLHKADAINVCLEPPNGACEHLSQQVSKFDIKTKTFPLKVQCKDCAEGTGRQAPPLHLRVTPKLLQVMLMTKMVHAYVQHNNSGDLHRDSLVACLLYVLKNGVQRQHKLRMDALDETFEKNMLEVRNREPGTVRPPLAACDYRTAAGQQRKTKKTHMKISGPAEKQTIKTFVANIRRCEGMHSKAEESQFKDACDRVVESLMESKAKSLDIVQDMIPKGMCPIVPSSLLSAFTSCGSPQTSTTVGVKRKLVKVLDSDDDDDEMDDDVVEIVHPRKKSPSNVSPERLAPVIPVCRGTIPVAAVARTRKEQVVLRDAPNDDADDESQESDGSDSGSESERESEGEETECERQTSPLNTPMELCTQPRVSPKNTPVASSNIQTDTPLARAPYLSPKKTPAASSNIQKDTPLARAPYLSPKKTQVANSNIQKDTPLARAPYLSPKKTRVANSNIQTDNPLARAPYLSPKKTQAASSNIQTDTPLVRASYLSPKETQVANSNIQTDTPLARAPYLSPKETQVANSNIQTDTPLARAPVPKRDTGGQLQYPDRYSIGSRTLPVPKRVTGGQLQYPDRYSTASRTSPDPAAERRQIPSGRSSDRRVGTGHTDKGDFKDQRADNDGRFRTAPDHSGERPAGERQGCFRFVQWRSGGHERLVLY